MRVFFRVLCPWQVSPEVSSDVNCVRHIRVSIFSDAGSGISEKSAQRPIDARQSQFSSEGYQTASRMLCKVVHDDIMARVSMLSDPI